MYARVTMISTSLPLPGPRPQRHLPISAHTPEKPSVSDPRGSEKLDWTTFNKWAGASPLYSQLLYLMNLRV